MSRKIVFINQATGYLTIDIINEFVKEFETVALITGSIRVQEVELNNRVKVNRIVKYNRGNVFRKATSWMIGTIQIYFLLKFKYRDFEKFFFTIPPTAYLFALNLDSLFSIAVFDLFPDALKVHKFKDKGIIYKWWSGKNGKIFSKAHRVFALSENMKTKILNYSDKSDVRVIPNWTAFSGYIPVVKEKNSIIESEGLTGKFIVQYSGNIGSTHNVEVIIEVAELLKAHNEVEFVIIGRGNRTIAIGDLIISKGLTNCRLLPFRKDEELFESLCSADLAIVTLDERTPDVSVPSKVYNIMAAGVPILAIAAMNSAISDLVLQHHIGKTFEMNKLQEICEFIIELKNNPSLWAELSDNSLRTSEKFTNSNAAEYLNVYIN
jgi:glycosyltransferase involved in cell wall biosynthesis